MLTFRDRARQTRLEGDLLAAGATVGDVLTVQPDGSLAPQTPGGTPAIVSPLAVPGCQLWHDASQLAGLNDGDPIPLLPDLSGNGRNAAQAVALNQPVYKAAIQNGLAAVRFDPTLNVQAFTYTGAALGMLAGAAGVTVAAVSGAVIGSNDYLLEWSNGADATQQRLAYETFKNFVVSNDDAGTADGVGLIPPPDSSVRAVSLTAVDLVADQPYQIAVDEFTSAVTFYSTISTGAIPNTPSLAAMLGCDLAGGGVVTLSDGAECDLCELALWTRALTSVERQQVVTYLAAKWAAV